MLDHIYMCISIPPKCEVYFGCRHEIFFYALFCITYAVVSVQIYFFVFDALPKPFDKHMITPATLAVHTDLDTVILQQPGEFQAGELATLVSIEDIRLAMLVYGCKGMVQMQFSSIRRISASSSADSGTGRQYAVERVTSSSRHCFTSDSA